MIESSHVWRQSMSGHRIQQLVRLPYNFSKDVLMPIMRRFITFEKWLVFCWTPNDMLPLVIRNDVMVKHFAEDDLPELHRVASGRLKEQLTLFFFKRGIHCPIYGFFYQGKLANTCWVYTSKDYEKEPFQTLKLGPNEAELKHGLTQEDVRGQGLLKYNLIYISADLFSKGFNRIYVTIDPSNYPSIRGVQRVGMKRCGIVWRLYLNHIPIGRKWAYRRLHLSTQP